MRGWGSRRRIGVLTAGGALLATATIVTASGGVFGADQTASTGALPASGKASSSATGSPDVAARQAAVPFTVTPVKTPSGHAAALKTVGVLGRGFTVPAGWQVIDLAAHPATCVRFDVHAVYIGTPGAEQGCPARGVGRHTGAVLIQPAAAHAAATATTAVDHPVAAEIDASAPGMTVTATYSSADWSTVVSALAAAHLPRPTVATVPVPPDAPVPTPTASAPTSPSASASPLGSPSESASSQPNPVVGHALAQTPTGVPLSVTNNISGAGFDACAAPSASQMAAWTAPASPFTAVGIYVGGSERACDQPNLTASWVSAEAQAGWHFMPIYVGWQAAWDWQPSTPSTLPAQLGHQSADDAVTQAQSLGFETGSVLYYDMEAYPSAAESAAMSFVSAWSDELRAKGYRAAVYSSENSGINDMVANIGHISEPDVIFIANWNGQEDPDPGAAPSNDWPHQRVHQYQGGANATYGGVTINIDRDYFDLTVAVCTVPAEPNRGMGGYTVPSNACHWTVAPSP
jgi:hypothetical protein